jgi:hypothetical protein
LLPDLFSFSLRLHKNATENDELKLRNPVPSPELDNILDLSYLNEPEILVHLKARYEHGDTFTYTGAVLLSINPFEDIIPTSDSKRLLSTFIYRIFSNNNNYEKDLLASMRPPPMLSRSPSKSASYRSESDDSDMNVLVMKKSELLMRTQSLNSKSFHHHNNSTNHAIGDVPPSPVSPFTPGSAISTTAADDETSRGLHTIIISGESGSGKTMCFKNILNLLSTSHDYYETGKKVGKIENSIVNQLLNCNVILEAFGNAKTVHTSNSSRFGKLYKFYLVNQTLKIIHCNISSYLIENSRICRQGKNERNFNIFYSFLLSSSAEEKKKFHLLSDINLYCYLVQGGSFTTDEMNHYTALNSSSSSTSSPSSSTADLPALMNSSSSSSAAVPSSGALNKYQEFLKAMETLTIHQYLIDEIKSILSGILLLGNLIFDDSISPSSSPMKNTASSESKSSSSSSGLSISAENEIIYNQASELLGITKEELQRLLKKKQFSSPNGESIELDLDSIHSSMARDAIVKLIYRLLFAYLVEELNIKLDMFAGDEKDHEKEQDESYENDPTHPSFDPHTGISRKLKRANSTNSSFIQLLDIYGFDSFEKNSIDQMCINYVNEMLHKQFNFFIFNIEMELYEQEAINYDKIEFIDNSDNCELIGNGIFRILDDQCRLPHPTDKRFIAQLYKEYDLHPLFSVSELQHGQDKFTIKHFAGNVEYSADDFIHKNLDYSPINTATLFSTSKNSILSRQFSAAVHISEIAVKKRGSIIAGGKGVGGGGGGGGGNDILSQLFSNKKFRFGSSLVTDFKNELTSLLKEIETTSPHYIKCIKSYDGEKAKKLREESSKTSAAPGTHNIDPKSSKVAKRFSIFNGTSVVVTDEGKSNNNNNNSLINNRFSWLSVAQQLRSNGILETVRIAITGYQCRLLYSDFYLRYRLIATDIDPNFDAPLLLKSYMTEVQIKLLCNRLCDVLSVGKENQPKMLSPGKRALSTRRASFNLHRQESFARTRSMKSLTSSTFDVNGFSASDGIIDRKNVQFGETKIFLKLQEYTFLEAFRNKCLKEFIIRIQRYLFGYFHRKHFIIMRKAAWNCQRYYRGWKTRKHVKRMKLVLVAILRIQRQFRKKRFHRSLTKIQGILRMFLAKKKLSYYKGLKTKLMTTYGQFIIARDMRINRRAYYQRLIQEEGEEGIIPTSFLSDSSIIKIPSLEKRLLSSIQQQETIKEKLILSNIISDVSTQTSSAVSPFASPSSPFSPASPFSTVSEKKGMSLSSPIAPLNGNNNNENENEELLRPIDESLSFDDLVKAWKSQILLLSETIASKGIKNKATKYSNYYLARSEDLLEKKGLLDFSTIGKMFGYSIWKGMQSFPLNSSDIPDIHLTDEHLIFSRIKVTMKKLSKFSAFLGKMLENIKNDILLKVQYEQHSTDIEIIKELRQLSKEFILYYSSYIRYFVNEFGNSSMFYHAFVRESLPSSSASGKGVFHKGHLRYLLALVDIIDKEKKYHSSSSSSVPSITSHKGTGGGGINGKKNHGFSLTVDWNDMINNTMMIAATGGGGSRNSNRNSTEFFLHLFGKGSVGPGAIGTESDTLRKLYEVFEGKEEFKLDNLRILSYNGLHFQYMPIQPGLEYAINSFRSLLCGEFPGIKQLLKIAGTRHQIGKSAYYSVYTTDSNHQTESSSTALTTSSSKKEQHQHHDHDNHSFMDVLYDPISVEQLHSMSFSSSILLCCLLGILNLQPNQISVMFDKAPVSPDLPSASSSAGNTTTAGNLYPLSTKTFSMSSDESPIKGGGGGRALTLTGSDIATIQKNNTNSAAINSNTNNSETVIKINSFHSDSLLSSGFLDFHNTYRLKVHEYNCNVLFYLPQMDEMFDPRLKNFLLSSTPFVIEELMIHWLRDCYDQNHRYDEMMKASSSMINGGGGNNNGSSKKGGISGGVSGGGGGSGVAGVIDTFTDNDFNNLGLPIKLAKGSIKEIIKRCHHVIDFLADHSHHSSSHHTAVTNSQLLREFFPHVSDYYEEIRHTSDFTESLEIGGVVSYAYAYHSSLKELKEWTNKLSQSVGIKGNHMYFENSTEGNTDETGSGTSGNSPMKGGGIGGLVSSFLPKISKANIAEVGTVEPVSKSLTTDSTDQFFSAIPVVAENPLRNMKKKNHKNSNSPLDRSGSKFGPSGSSSSSDGGDSIQQHLKKENGESTSTDRIVTEEMNLDDIYEVHQSIRFGSFEADQFSTHDPTPRSTIPGSSVQGGGNNDSNFGQFNDLYAVKSVYSMFNFGSKSQSQSPIVMNNTSDKQIPSHMIKSSTSPEIPISPSSSDHPTSVERRETLNTSFDYGDVYASNDDDLMNVIPASLSTDELDGKKKKTSGITITGPSTPVPLLLSPSKVSKKVSFSDNYNNDGKRAKSSMLKGGDDDADSSPLSKKKIDYNESNNSDNTSHHNKHFFPTQELVHAQEKSATSTPLASGRHSMITQHIHDKHHPKDVINMLEAEGEGKEKKDIDGEKENGMKKDRNHPNQHFFPKSPANSPLVGSTSPVVTSSPLTPSGKKSSKARLEDRVAATRFKTGALYFGSNANILDEVFDQAMSRAEIEAKIDNELKKKAENGEKADEQQHEQQQQEEGEEKEFSFAPQPSNLMEKLEAMKRRREAFKSSENMTASTYAHPSHSMRANESQMIANEKETISENKIDDFKMESPLRQDLPLSILADSPEKKKEIDHSILVTSSPPKKNETLKMIKRKQTFLQSDDIKIMNGKLLPNSSDGKQFINDASKEFTKRVAPLDSTIEDEANDFLKEIDFRSIAMKSAEFQRMHESSKSSGLGENEEEPENDEEDEQQHDNAVEEKKKDSSNSSRGKATSSKGGNSKNTTTKDNNTTNSSNNKKTGKKEKKKMDFSSRLCALLGKNFSFLETFHLKNINENQLKSMFSYFLKLYHYLAQQQAQSLKLGKSAIPSSSTAFIDLSNPILKQKLISLQTRLLYLYFDNKEELNTLKKSLILYQLKKELNFEIKLVYNPPSSASSSSPLRLHHQQQQKPLSSSPSTPLMSLPSVGGQNNHNQNEEETPETLKNSNSTGEEQPSSSLQIETSASSSKHHSPLPQAFKTQSGRFIPPSRNSIVDQEVEFTIDYTIQFIMGNNNSSNSTNERDGDGENNNKNQHLPASSSFHSPSGKIGTTSFMNNTDTMDDEDDSLLFSSKEKGGNGNSSSATASTEPVEDKELKQEMLTTLMKSSNMFSSSIKTPQGRQEMKLKIDAVKSMINQLAMKPVNINSIITDNTLMKSFEYLLLEFPSLSSIAIVLGENKGFQKNLFFLYTLIDHKYMERYIELIYEIIKNHPDVLIMIDSDGYLPCDRIKAIADYYYQSTKRDSTSSATSSSHASNRLSTISNTSSSPSHPPSMNLSSNTSSTNTASSLPSPQKVNAKYQLLARIINFVGQSDYRYLQTINRAGLGKGIFSYYREEEELIILSTYYDFIATSDEFINSMYLLGKKDKKKHLPLLTKLIYKEICYHYSSSNHSSSSSEQLLTVYNLLNRCLQSRISQRYSTKEEVLSWIKENIEKEKIEGLFHHKEDGKEITIAAAVVDDDEESYHGEEERKTIRHSQSDSKKEGNSEQNDNRVLELSFIYKNVQEVWGLIESSH